MNVNQPSAIRVINFDFKQANNCVQDENLFLKFNKNLNHCELIHSMIFKKSFSLFFFNMNITNRSLIIKNNYLVASDISK